MLPLCKPSAILLALLPHTGAAFEPTCEDWCTEPCAVLNGNVQIECALCSADAGARCYPGADGYDGWEERARAYQLSGGEPASSEPPETAPELYPGCTTLRCRRVREKRQREAKRELELAQLKTKAEGRGQRVPPPSPPPRSSLPANPPPSPARPRPSVAPPRSPGSSSSSGGGRGGRSTPSGLGTRHDGKTAGGVDVPCELQRITRSELVALTPSARSELLEFPTVISGMIDDWPAMQPAGWASPRNFSARFGHHRVLAKRTIFGIERANALRVDLPTASVSLRELVQHTKQEHIIVLDEYGKGASEEALLTDLSSEFHNPDVFESASQCRVFSFGGGHRGVQMMQHGVAWLGLVSEAYARGAKRGAASRMPIAFCVSALPLLLLTSPRECLCGTATAASSSHHAPTIPCLSGKRREALAPRSS